MDASTGRNTDLDVLHPRRVGNQVVEDAEAVVHTSHDERILAVVYRLEVGRLGLDERDAAGRPRIEKPRRRLARQIATLRRVTYAQHHVDAGEVMPGLIVAIGCSWDVQPARDPARGERRRPLVGPEL